VIVGFAELLRAEESSPERRTQLDDILEAAGRLRRVASDLSDVVNLEAAALELTRAPFDLATIVADVVEGLRLSSPARGVQLEVAADTPVPLVSDVERVQQALHRLLVRVLRSAPHGSRLTISVAPPGSDAHVRVDIRGVALETSVEEDEDLGTVLARGLVAALAGRIETRLETDGIRTLSITLPVDTGEPSALRTSEVV